MIFLVKPAHRRDRGVDFKSVRAIFKTAIRENIVKILDGHVEDAEFFVVGSRQVAVSQDDILLVDNFGIRGERAVFDAVFRRNPVCILFDNKTIVVFLVRTVMDCYFVLHTIFHAITGPKQSAKRIDMDGFPDGLRNFYFAAGSI